MNNTEQLLMQIIRRQNAMLDMMSSFLTAYAKVNELPVENVEEEIENDVE
ncbi:MAG: hypothetical protein J6D12_03775 [Peptostreptococcaceae bacterium]|nr:hypothetical protein [Peptostreptococcaceae bacterium]